MEWNMSPQVERGDPQAGAVGAAEGAERGGRVHCGGGAPRQRRAYRRCLPAAAGMGAALVRYPTVTASIRLGDVLAACRVSPVGSRWRCGRSQTRVPCPSSPPPSSPFPSETSKFSRCVRPKANRSGSVGAEQDLLSTCFVCLFFNQ